MQSPARIALTLGYSQAWERASEPEHGEICPVCGGWIATPHTYCLGCCRTHPAMDGPINGDRHAHKDNSGPTKYDPGELDGGTTRRPPAQHLSPTEQRQLAFLVAHDPRLAHDPKVLTWLADHASP